MLAYSKPLEIPQRRICWAFHNVPRTSQGSFAIETLTCLARRSEDGLSASSDSINRAATIHGSSGGYHARDRPSHQPDAGSYDAAGRIANVLAVDHGTGRFTACDHESGH